MGEWMGETRSEKRSEGRMYDSKITLKHDDHTEA